MSFSTVTVEYESALAYAYQWLDMDSQEGFDLAFAVEPRTGFDLDAIEGLRRDFRADVDRQMSSLIFYGRTGAFDKENETV